MSQQPRAVQQAATAGTFGQILSTRVKTYYGSQKITVAAMQRAEKKAYLRREKKAEIEVVSSCGSHRRYTDAYSESYDFGRGQP